MRSEVLCSTSLGIDTKREERGGLTGKTCRHAYLPWTESCQVARMGLFSALNKTDCFALAATQLVEVLTIFAFSMWFSPTVDASCQSVLPYDR